MSKILRCISTITIFTLILGCAAAGVPYTSDPDKKISYAYQLMSTNRYIPAKKLLDEAVEIYEKNKDIKGQVEANFAYGNYYKQVSDWTSAKSKFSKSKEIAQNTDWQHAAARAEFELGIVSIELNNKDLTSFCPHAMKALNLYNKGIKNGEQWTFKLFDGKPFSDLVKENQVAAGCIK